MATRRDTKTAFMVLEDNRERARKALQRLKEMTIEEPLVVNTSMENINYNETFTIPWSQIEWTSLLSPLLRNEFLKLLESNKELKTEIKEDKSEKVIDRFKRMVVIANHKNKKKKL